MERIIEAQQGEAGALPTSLNLLGLYWTKIRNIASPIGLLVLGLVGGAPAMSHTGKYGACPESDLIPYSALPLATEKGIGRRCSLLREIEKGGRTIPNPLRAQILRELSNRFAVEINYTGVVELPGDAVDFLLDNIRDTAMLVSIYSGNEYQAITIEPPQGSQSFMVTNNDSFFAVFSYLYSRESPDTSEHMFFETGHARVLFWWIWGNSLIRYSLHKNDDNTSRYDIDVFIFTESRLLRAVLNSRLFLRFSREMFEDILRDIESATHEFSLASNPADKLPPSFVRELKTRLK